MPSDNRVLREDLPLQGLNVPLETLLDSAINVHLHSIESLHNQHHVSAGALCNKHDSEEGDPLPQRHNTNHLLLSEKVMSDCSSTELLLGGPISVLPTEPTDHFTNAIHGFPVTPNNCDPFHAGATVGDEFCATDEAVLTDLTCMPYQAKDQLSHQPKELGDPTSTLQYDMETCNDSSSNELNESSENEKDAGSKSSSDFRPPPCRSNAFSLMMADSEHNPSTSGYSSEQPAKAKTQKDLLKILKELRSYLPAERRSRGKSSTAASLRYALHCMQQVKANEEYYQLLMVNEERPCSMDLSCYTVQEIANITSEYTKNNLDVFAVAVSLVSGRILYISEQASAVLRCSRDVFSQVQFVELLAPQDVSVFYSSTTPYRLPSWSLCNGADSGYLDGLEEKSFYCRVSCGRESRRGVSYQPFRLSPYLIRTQTEESTMEQLCCVLFAERVHSGYEAPRIPADKRIFTTTHTPNCLFQDVDERAVPLLGYLPQDLIGTPIIMHLHPNDRPLMLALHKKILQSGGQPFDFSPIRFCARNGEYVTIDTSWSSFINPWSRKVSFIIGRHKVRMGPVNEDVFTALSRLEDRCVQPEVHELTEQIQQLLMQPVHNGGSSGYSSLGSNGSHENPMSGASSSDSNGNLNEDVKEKHSTLAVHGIKEDQGSSSPKINYYQNIEIAPDAGILRNVIGGRKDVSSGGTGVAACPLQSEPLAVKQSPYSYQQISCLDSVIRYLESCTALASEKSKMVSSGNAAHSTSADDCLKMQAQKDSADKPLVGMPSSTHCQLPASVPVPISGPTTSCHLPSPGSLPHSSLTTLAVPGAAITQLSMGAKADSVASLTSHCSYSSTIVHVGDKKLQPEPELEDGLLHPEIPLLAPGPTEKEPYKQLGLTKQVLLAHTQKEENNFLCGFMDTKRLSAFQTRCNSYMNERPRVLRTCSPHGIDGGVRRSGKARKAKTKRVRPESWDSSSSGLPHAHRCPLPGLNTTAWSHSDTSHASYPPMPYPVLPAYPLTVFPTPQAPVPNETPHGAPSNTCPMQPFHTPILSPMVALVLPNYLYPAGVPPAVYPGAVPPNTFPVQPPLYMPQQAFTASNPAFPVPQSPFLVPQPMFPPTSHAFPVPQPSSASHSVQTPCNVQPFAYPVAPSEPKTKEGISRSSTPRDPQSPPLFQSRCSSPLQLNLLQLEESQKTDRSEGGTGVGGGVSSTFMPQPLEDPELLPSRPGSPADGLISDALSTGSDLMDILLQEDASFGTCSASSAVSESLTSGSNGNGTSGSQTGSSQTSHSSKYFGSVDSSENNQKARWSKSASNDCIMKYVLQDPMWLLMANADENVMMSYQIPVRDMDAALREDRDRLKSMQKLQPRFTDEQRKELSEIHPWILRGELPQAVGVSGCVFCKDRSSDCAEYADTIQELELSGIMESYE